MSLRSREKITAQIRFADRSMRVRQALVTAFCLGVVMALPARATYLLDSSDFNKIRFSEGCAEKQWTQSPDGNLELILGPRQSPCEATLDFHFPVETTRQSAISFQMQGSKPGLNVQLGIRENDNQEPVYAPPFHVRQRWVSDGARLRHIKGDWAPRQIASLHFVVPPNPDARWGTVTIRAIQLMRVGKSISPPPPSETAASSPAPLAASSLKEAGVAQPVTPHPVSRRLPLAHGLKILLSAAAVIFLAWPLRLKSRRRRILSPLYELNMRTWKTQRDAHDVVQWGGFRNVSVNDLKAIKDAGFNTLWLMGIWEVGAKVRDISRNYAADFQGSPFAIYDYCVASDLGTDTEFRDLVQRAHNLRLSVMVDFVPNHMGLDSAWLNDHPEYFIHRVLDASEAVLPDDELKLRYPGYFPYRTPCYPEGPRRVPKTLMIAYGKDPYFYPWIDTAQLDYAQPGLRQRMIDVLCHWAKIVDGVRCDMAMLTLREQVKIHRHPEMSWDAFNQLMPHEFWPEAIQAVKRINPNFVFMAETYWSLEGFLQDLGFDYTYNKPLYEAICGAMHNGHAEGLMNFLRLLGTDYLKRSVHFLENHDEERAMNALGEERQRAAAAILCTLPGISLIHQGQMEGKRERLPVQRVIPVHQETADHDLYAFYQGLLKATSRPVFQEGRFTPLYSNNSALVSYVRVDTETKVLVVVNTSQKKQTGSVFLVPGLPLHSGTRYHLNDLFYPFKSNTTETIQPSYNYPGAKLINQGVYIELEPFDAHIFVVEPQGALHATQNAMQTTRQVIEEWPLNRMARRFRGLTYTRSSDTPEEPTGASTRKPSQHLAANPAGRQQ